MKQLPQTVNRQKVIGNYIVDFYCSEAKLIIELDGSQHYEIKGQNSDIARDSFLKGLGIGVLRYSNRDVNHNFEGVCEDIMHHLTTSFGGASPQGKAYKAVNTFP